MNIIVPRTIQNIVEMTSKLIKIWSALFALWKHGKYEDRVMPTVKELEKLIGLTDKPINDAIKALQRIRVEDRYHQTFPLLRISTKKINGVRTTVYKLAAPEIGELTDPSLFSQEGGGSAMMEIFHGYITITDEIQKLGLSTNNELILAVWNNIAEYNKYNYPVYNTRTPHTLHFLECMKLETVKRGTYELYKMGYLNHSEPIFDKSWGWRTVSVNINQKQDETTEEDTDMDSDKLLELIEKAMEDGNNELAMELTKKLPNEQKPAKVAPKKAEKKAKKRGVEEIDLENKYIKVYLTMTKEMAKRSDVLSMIDEIKNNVAYENWIDADDIEASGFIEAMRDYEVSMSYEIIKEAPKVEYEPETLEDIIAASKAESVAMFKNEPEFVDQAVKVIEESGVLNKQQPKPQQKEPEQDMKKEEVKEKVLTPEQIAFREAIESEKSETRKQRIYQFKQEEEEVDFDWLAAQV